MAYRDYPQAASSHPDLNDYYDPSSLPPPHRLSDFYSSTPRLSSDHLSSNVIPRNGAPVDFLEHSNSSSGGYQPVSTGVNVWTDRPVATPRSNRKRWIIIGVGVALLLIMIIVVAVGVTVSRNKKSTPSNNTAKAVTSDPNDPSNFSKNPSLHNSFWGMAYTPAGSQLPQCGNNLSAVIEDIQIMSQLTTRLRLYGADCNQTALVLEAIKQTKANIEVYLGIYNVPNDNHAAYQRQRDTILDALRTYGTDHVAGVTVGNEFMLNYVNSIGTQDPNSEAANAGAAILVADIQDFRSAMSGLSLSKTIPVGNADAGSFFSNLVLEQVDYGMSNVHAWFANTSIQDAAGWTYDFFENTNVVQAQATTKKPTMYIAEVGWPSKSSDAGNANNGASDASEVNLQTFLNNWVCQANANNTGYFYFEQADEPWKDQQFGGVEGWWGLLNSNNTLKNINIPNCSHS